MCRRFNPGSAHYPKCSQIPAKPRPKPGLFFAVAIGAFGALRNSFEPLLRPHVRPHDLPENSIEDHSEFAILLTAGLSKTVREIEDLLKLID